MCSVGGQQATVLRGPESHHGALGIAPKGAVGIEVLWGMLDSGKVEKKQRKRMKANQVRVRVSFNTIFSKVRKATLEDVV